MLGGGLNSLDAIESKLDKLLAKVRQVDSLVSNTYRATGGGKMGGFSANAPSGGGNLLSNSFGNVPAFQQIASGGRKVLEGLGQTFGAVGQIAAGMGMMMPDVGMTVTRESGYYGAGVATGAMVGRGQLQAQTRLGLGQFTTSAGSDAAVAAILATRGVVPGSANYLQTVAGVAGAARYLNMPNEVAARSITQTTMGPASAGFMRSFGIFTANPQTGEKYSEAQIFEQVYRRATAGRGQATVEETLESLNRGFLGETIRNMNMLDDAGKARLSQYFVDKATGLTVDITDSGSLDSAIARNKQQGYENPFLAAYQIASKETQNMEAATGVYLSGIQQAADALSALKDITRDELIPRFGELNAAIQTFVGNRTGAGLLTGGVKAATGALGKQSAARAAGPSTGTSGVAKFAKVGIPAVAATAVGSIMQGSDNAAVADFGRTLGYAGAGASIGAMVGSVVPGVGTALGAAVGGLLGTGYAMIAPGEGGSGSTSASSGRALTDTTATGGNGGFRLGRPVPGPIRAKFKQKYSSFDPTRMIWPDGHRGIDFDANAGQPITAAAAGMATSHTSSGFGNYVKIRHENGMYTFYAHMSRAVVNNKYVARGEVIGFVGSTGRSSAPHLHFALSRTDSTNHPHVVDPVPYMDGGASYASDAQASNQTSATTALNQSSGVSASAPQSTFSNLSSSNTSATSTMYASLASSGRATGSTFPTVSAYSASSYYRGEGGSGAVMRGGNNVQINLSIAKASEDEARRFASWLKDYLEEEKLTDRMGAY
jgi:murein DD-endopeptidase MepM/ murein hydrolase activator NlpD